MTYKRCKSCKKLFLQSPYDKSKYRIYCNGCGVDIMTQDIRETERRVTAVPGMSTGCRELKRTDDEDCYLDSTRCEYTRTEVEEMKSKLQEQLLRKSNLKLTIRKLYDNINACDEKIQDLNCKLAIAQREQHLRKKLRRETRELIPSLETVQKETTSVYRNINELLNENDIDDCITIKDLKDPLDNTKN